jgi:hypothetical protein
VIGDHVGSSQTRSFGDVGSMSGLPESGHGWAIYEYTPLGILTALSSIGVLVFAAMMVAALMEALDAYRRRP